jgi:hypothetical protein
MTEDTRQMTDQEYLSFLLKAREPGRAHRVLRDEVLELRRRVEDLLHAQGATVEVPVMSREPEFGWDENENTKIESHYEALEMMRRQA